MAAEQNKALMRRFFDEVVNQGQLELIDELVADDFVEHESFPGLPSTGPAAPREAFKMFLGAFPDMQFAAEDMIAEGDKVATRVTMTGTHKGEFMGIPATNKQFSVQAMDIVQFRDGKAIAHWGVTDQAAMMEQLGLTSET